MHRRICWLLLFALPGLGALTGCRGRSAALTAATPPEAGPDGAAILQRSCIVCHDLGGLSAYAESWGVDRWRSMVETMISYEAMLTPTEVGTLAGYLGEKYGTAGNSGEAARLLQSACTT